jgi:hypothetical protein
VKALACCAVDGCVVRVSMVTAVVLWVVRWRNPTERSDEATEEEMRVRVLGNLWRERC